MELSEYRNAKIVRWPYAQHLLQGNQISIKEAVAYGCIFRSEVSLEYGYCPYCEGREYEFSTNTDHVDIMREGQTVLRFPGPSYGEEICRCKSCGRILSGYAGYTGVDEAGRETPRITKKPDFIIEDAAQISAMMERGEI